MKIIVLPDGTRYLWQLKASYDHQINHIYGAYITYHVKCGCDIMEDVLVDAFIICSGGLLGSYGRLSLDINFTLVEKQTCTFIPLEDTLVENNNCT